MDTQKRTHFHHFYPIGQGTRTICEEAASKQRVSYTTKCTRQATVPVMDRYTFRCRFYRVEATCTDRQSVLDDLDPSKWLRSRYQTCKNVRRILTREGKTTFGTRAPSQLPLPRPTSLVTYGFVSVLTRLHSYILRYSRLI